MEISDTDIFPLPSEPNPHEQDSEDEGAKDCDAEEEVEAEEVIDENLRPDPRRRRNRSVILLIHWWRIEEHEALWREG